MTPTLNPPPPTPVEPVTETLHGVNITDPYRWLEDQSSTRTRNWVEEQTAYARAHLDRLPGRARIGRRVRQYLDVESYDSVQRIGERYFFRKRVPGKEQFGIYLREGLKGKDELLLDPAEFGTGEHTAVQLHGPSANGRLLLYEVKEGGEQVGTYCVYDVEARKTLPDVPPKGTVAGFDFGPDGKGFYLVRETGEAGHSYQVAFHHALGTPFEDDREVFRAGEGEWLRLLADGKYLVIVVYHDPLSLASVRTDIHLRDHRDTGNSDRKFLLGANGAFAPQPVGDRIFAITNSGAKNSKVVELKDCGNGELAPFDVVPEADVLIQSSIFSRKGVLLSYLRGTETEIVRFDFSGKRLGTIPTQEGTTVRLLGGSEHDDDVMLEMESFTQPKSIYRWAGESNELKLWARTKMPFESERYAHTKVHYTSKDGTLIPMFLVGRRDVLESGTHPAIMTSYGGFGMAVTPEFSVLVAILAEAGCLFALPNIRGGGEFGAEWHEAAKRRNRQRAYDDFICAAEWLIANRRTTPERLAIFGGSNSGLLVAVALTQRPDLFRAVLCLVPIADMLRFHLFDKGSHWVDEFGTPDDPEDFGTLFRYSPYQNVRAGEKYPAVMIVSGDADGRCNPMHARKLAARLQAATCSGLPVILDYNKYRGHSPVLPLSDRVHALTDRIAFLGNQVQLGG